MSFDVFISYSTKDAIAAKAACAALEAAKIRCWMAPRDIAGGARWGASIVRAINQCRAMVLIFTGNANESAQVRREVDQAFSKGKTVVPLRIEDVRPADDLAYYLDSVHWLDALTPPLERNLGKLVTTVQALVSAPEEDGPSGQPTIDDAMAAEAQDQARVEDERRGQAVRAEDRAVEAAERERQDRQADVERNRVAALEAKMREQEAERRREAALEQQRAQAERRSADERRSREETDATRRREENEKRALLPPKRRRTGLFIGGLASVVVAGAFGAWLMLSPTPPLVTPTPAPVTPAPAPATRAEPAAYAPLSTAEERALKPKDTFQECTNCPVMMVVPAGSFTMGSPASEPGRMFLEDPPHKVTLAHPFAVAQFELTFEEWDACVADGGCNGYKPSDEGWGRGRQPVINVSWNDAQSYVAWLAKKTGKPYRLLTEAEYEYAARGGTTTIYPWGNDTSLAEAGCPACSFPARVGRFPPNDFGLHDMVGNVGEWTEDCAHVGYKGAPANGTAWTTGQLCDSRVIRGASFKAEPVIHRSAHRDAAYIGRRDKFTGFRVARTLLAPFGEYVASLGQNAGSPAAFVVVVNVASRTASVRRVTAPPDQGKSYELWLVSDRFVAPRSLGVLAADTMTRLTLAGYDPATIIGATYAISLEPEGGSSTGQPTGPVIFTGKLVATATSQGPL